MCHIVSSYIVICTHASDGMDWSHQPKSLRFWLWLLSVPRRVPGNRLRPYKWFRKFNSEPYLGWSWSWLTDYNKWFITHLCFGILVTFFGAPKRMTRGVDKQMLGAAQISLKSYRTKKTRGSSTSHVFFKHIFRPIVVNVARCAARSIGPLGSWRGSPISTWWRLGEVLPGTIFICTKKKTMCSQSAAWKQIKFPICSWTAFGFFHWPV